MKRFIEWIKNLFFGVKVLKKEQLLDIVDKCDNELLTFFDLIDEDKDGVITMREIIKKSKELKK